MFGNRLEEVDQQPSVNISFLPVSQLFKMNSFWSVPPRWLSWKTSYPCYQTIETEGQQGFSLTSVIKLTLSLALLKHEVNERGFVFEGFGVTCHKLNHFNSRVFILDFNWNCCRLQQAKKFSRNPGQFKCVTREIRYHVSIAKLLIRNL